MTRRFPILLSVEPSFTGVNFQQQRHDSLSAGPELDLIIEHLEAYIRQGLPFGAICREIKAYQEKAGMLVGFEKI